MSGSSVVNLNDFNIALTRRVAELLYSHDPDTYGALDVVVQGNVAKLRGTVVGEERRARVVELAKSIEGIRSVDDRLKVRPSRDRKAPPTVGRPLSAAPAADPRWQRLAGPTIVVVLVAAVVAWQFVPREEEAPKTIGRLIPAAGAIYVDGKPAQGAELEFWPLQALDSRAPRPRATADDQGRYQVQTPDAGEGAPAGIYAVTVRLRHAVVEGGGLQPGADIVSEEFRTPHTSPLRVEIAPHRSHTNLPTLHLAKISNAERDRF